MPKVSFLEKLAEEVASKFYWIAGASIVAMMFLTCADVVLRFFRRPIPGTYELVSFFSAMSVAFAMAYTTLTGGHVAVSLVVRLLPARIQGVIGTLTNTFSLILFGLLSWQSVLYAETLRASGEVSLTLQLPFYPFVYGVGLAAGAVCLVVLVDLIKSLATVMGQ